MFSLQIEKLKEQVKHSEHQLKVQSSDHETQLLRLRTEVCTVHDEVYLSLVVYTAYIFVYLVKSFKQEL